MNPELEKQLEALIGKISNKEDFHAVRDQLLKRGIESLLKGEMTAHLGYQKGNAATARQSEKRLF
jgi:transposase-like protein